MKTSLNPWLKTIQDVLLVRQKRALVLRNFILLIIGILATSFLGYYSSRKSLRKELTQSELPLTGDNIYSEIQRDVLRPVFISSLIAHDTFLRDWVLERENDYNRLARYLKNQKSHSLT